MTIFVRARPYEVLGSETLVRSDDECDSKDIVINPGRRTGGPLKPGFGLSGAVLLRDRVSLPLFRVFVFVYSDSTCSAPHGLLTSQQQVPQLHRSSLCDDLLGRDDRIEEI